LAIHVLQMLYYVTPNFNDAKQGLDVGLLKYKGQIASCLLQGLIWSSRHYVVAVKGLISSQISATALRSEISRNSGEAARPENWASGE
jgi:hypothetical protein